MLAIVADLMARSVLATVGMNQMTVWMDGEEAQIFHVDPASVDQTTVRAPKHHLQRHPKDQATKSRSHPDDEQHFFREISKALSEASAILLVGPSMAKLHFLRYLQKHSPVIEARIVGVETADHPTAPQIVAHARAYFDVAAPRLGT